MALTDNLVSYWKLDESSGNAADSVGSNTLTNNNTTAYVTGKINNGADFEKDSSQSLSISDASDNPSLRISGSFSISAWIQLESALANEEERSIVGKFSLADRNYCLELYNNGGTMKLALDHGSGGVDTFATVNWSPSTATWYHVVATTNGTVTKFYVNGSQQGSDVADTQANSGGAASFQIGNNDRNFYWDGIIDEVGIWNRALTSTEVTELYNSGAGLQYPFSGGGGVANHWLLMGV